MLWIQMYESLCQKLAIPGWSSDVFTEGKEKSLPGIKQRNALNPELGTKTEGGEALTVFG